MASNQLTVPGANLKQAILSTIVVINRKVAFLFGLLN
jgi:hypothetical protein